MRLCSVWVWLCVCVSVCVCVCMCMCDWVFVLCECVRGMWLKEEMKLDCHQIWAILDELNYNKFVKACLQLLFIWIKFVSHLVNKNVLTDPGTYTYSNHWCIYDVKKAFSIHGNKKVASSLKLIYGKRMIMGAKRLFLSDWEKGTKIKCL